MHTVVGSASHSKTIKFGLPLQPPTVCVYTFPHADSKNTVDIGGDMELTHEPTPTSRQNLETNMRL